MSERIAAVRSAYSQSSRTYRTWCWILAVLVLLGLAAFIRQTLLGEQVTNLTNTEPWGLYIAGFVFFVGASAGATIIGLLVHAFGREEYAHLATRALLVGLLALIAAVTNIAVDVGKFERMFFVPFIWQNPTSMFFYTSLTYYMFGIILVAELYYTVKLTRGTADERDRKKAKWLAIGAVPFALAILHAPHGALFAVVKAREFWNNPLLPPHFATVALVSGTALIILVAVLSQRYSKREIVSSKALAYLGTLLGFFIAVAALMDFFDFLVFTYSDMPEGNEAWHFLTGDHLPLSIIHVGGYIAALAILLTRRGREVPRITWAAALTVAAVAAYRVNLTIVGLGVPLLPFMGENHYFPSWSEWLVEIGIVSGIALAYLILVKALPMEEDAAEQPVSPAAVPPTAQPGEAMGQTI